MHLRCCALLCLLLLLGPAMSVHPPAYLGICQWKDCVGEKQVGTHKIICLPEERPADCPEASWNQLHALDHELEKC